ncbi:unnamed protein product [Didymodactylos carnosus]|uniref:EGF-like domain-containing protein n=1 Tax=Didymodactylos carnosus TaxID=1234261 RepID=A0A814MGN0_9BILA|nr:unnamed protein product [Didymodactylos carnosus]CAF1120574.1 unnamed protein product [Didymodactylos carnosus]CAF3845373.1 unnamed protein product [Didymodactylos carnosus]CAF3894223.1 unnamed protein product [Didymodactylos carnosus]
MNLPGSAVLLLVLISSVISYKHDSLSEKDRLKLLKRFLFHKDTTTWTPSVIDNLFTRSTTDYYGYRTSTYSPSGSKACSSYPCLNNGICTPTGSLTYDCRCVGPWRGVTCGVGKLPSLVLEEVFSGTNCQTKFYQPGDTNYNQYTQSKCSPNPCRNGGTCMALTTTYYCRCRDNNYGENYFRKREYLNDQILDDKREVLDAEILDAKREAEEEELSNYVSLLKKRYEENESGDGDDDSFNNMLSRMLQESNSAELSESDEK